MRVADVRREARVTLLGAVLSVVGWVPDLVAQTKHVYVEAFASRWKVDDTPVIQAALDHAKSLPGDVVVHFKAKKCYRVSKSTGSTLHPLALLIDKGASITLDGHGAELRCASRDAIILHVRNSTHITVRGLRFDYYPCQFTQGRVIGVKGNTFDLRIDPGFPTLDDRWFGQTQEPLRHHAIHLQKAKDEWVYDSAAHVWLKWRKKAGAPGVWTCWSGHAAANVYGWYEYLDVAQRVKKDHRFVIAGIDSGDGGLGLAGYPTLFVNCDDCGIQDCDFYNGEAFTQCFGGTRMTVSKCRFIPRKGDAPEGVDRAWAGVGDGALFEQMRDGPRVVDCEIRCVPDDIMNLNCPPYLCYRVQPRAGGKVALLLGGWIRPYSVRVGDELAISDGTTGLTKAVVKVRAVEYAYKPPEPAFVAVVVDGPLPPLNVIRATLPCWSRHYRNSADKIENLTASNNGAVIRGNRFDTCGNFLRIPTRNALIEGNVFSNIAETPIMGEIDTFLWLDWPRPQGVRIHRNRFVHCQWTRGFHDQRHFVGWERNDHHRLFRQGIIHFASYRWSGGMTQPIVRDIEVTDNIIEGWGQSAIYIQGGTIDARTTRNLIRGNKLIERKYEHAKVMLKGQKTYPIQIVNSEETDVLNTDVQLLSDSTAGAALRIARDSAASIAASFATNSSIPAHVKWIRDERDGTSVLDSTRTGTYSHVGNGCGCSGPDLGFQTVPTRGESLVMTIQNVRTAPQAGFVIGFQEMKVPLAVHGAPGCTQWVAPALTIFATNVGGTASLAIGIPDAAAIVGVGFYVQGFTADPSANQLGYVVTNALRGVVGKR